MLELTSKPTMSSSRLTPFRRTSLQRCAALLSLSMLLAACENNPSNNNTPLAYPTETDGPPPGKLDPQQISDAVPQYEPRSRYGNHSPYTVFGKQYEVMQNSQSLVQEGVASWYGTKFHGKRTSSWEPYDMFTMTAAHRELPLPTYAKVTNLQNNRQVIVKVNDRGPFHGDRIIDLSYAAAVKLGFAEKGTARVRVEAIPMASLQPPPSNVSNPSQPPTVGAYSTNNRPANSIANPIANTHVPTSGSIPINGNTNNTHSPQGLTPQATLRNQLASIRNANGPSTNTGYPGTNHSSTPYQPNVVPVPRDQIERLYIQVGAFADEARAQQIKAQLSNWVTFPITIKPSQSTGLFKVQIGPLRNSVQAQAINQLLAKEFDINAPMIVWN